LREWHETRAAAEVEIDPVATPLTFGTWIGVSRMITLSRYCLRWAPAA
jgi:hypothetical protein